MNSVVVYRNPMEQWFWEGGWFYIGVAFLLYGVYICGMDLWQKYKNREKK